MLSEHDLRKFNALICALSKASYKIKKIMKALRASRDQYKKKLEEILENRPYNEIEIHSYADQIASIENVLAIFNRLALMVDALRIRLITFRQFTLALKHIGPDLDEARRIADDISKKEGWIKRSLENVMEWIGTLTAEIREGIEGIGGSVSDISIRNAGEVLNEVLKELREGKKVFEREAVPQEKLVVGPEQAQVCEEIALASSTTDGGGGDRQEDRMDRLERDVLSYIEKNGGKINLTKCASDLGLSPKEVLEVLRRLMDKNLIRLGG